jgi:hypothetical protein
LGYKGKNVACVKCSTINLFLPAQVSSKESSIFIEAEHRLSDWLKRDRPKSGRLPDISKETA